MIENMENPLEGLPTFIKKSAIARKLFVGKKDATVRLSHKEKQAGRDKFTPANVDTLISITEGFKYDLETYLLKLKSFQK
jgi:hypothetical protein